MEIKTKAKNHWTQTKIDEANKKVNQDIYKRNRQAPIQIKLDDMIIFINDRITRRGIAKGLVFIQEDLNKNILEVQKITIQILLSKDIQEQVYYLEEVKKIIKIQVWSDIRFLMINKAITPEEITELIRRQIDINNDLDKWQTSLNNAISAER